MVELRPTSNIYRFYFFIPNLNNDNIFLGQQNGTLAVFADCHLNLGNTRTTMHNSSFLVTMNTGAHHKLEFALLRLR